MHYILYNNASSIESLLVKAMGLCKYFPPSTLNVRHLISTSNQSVYRPQQTEIEIIEKYICKLGHIDFFMEIIVIFTLLSCMSLPKCIHHLLKFPTMSQMIDMIILQQFELPFAQTQIDINYEKDQDIL